MEPNVCGYAVKAYEHYRTEEGRKYYIVLAGPSSGQMWVTWECTNGNDFYWGHYFASEAAARSDFHKRLAEKYAAY